jgi:hypothetical protein
MTTTTTIGIATRVSQQCHTTDTSNRTLESFTKKNLFRNVKFINGDQELEGCTDIRSIGFFVTKRLHVPVDGREEWWAKNKKSVATNIGIRRNNCCSDMKKVVIGEYIGAELTIAESNCFN